MVELADASDSKSDDGNIMWVQVPLPAPNITYTHVVDTQYFIIVDSFGVLIENNNQG